MSEAFKCDRCGKFFDAQLKDLILDHWEFCKKCSESWREWYKAGRNES